MDTKTQNTSSHKTPSIKKLYLEKRAVSLKNTFEKHKNNFKTFIEEIQSNSFNATKDELLFSKCLTWMHANTNNEASIAELAKELGVSVRKIQRLFSFFLGKTYTNVLLDMRIELAKNYLEQQKFSVGEVAYFVGIKDHAYFTYLFRKTTGMTPSEYRLSLIRNQVAS